MAWFTDNPLERMMTQPPKTVLFSGELSTPLPPEHPCNGCPYGQGKPCIGSCLKEILRKKQAEGVF